MSTGCYLLFRDKAVFIQGYSLWGKKRRAKYIRTGKAAQEGYHSQQKISSQPNSSHARIHLRPRKYNR